MQRSLDGIQSSHIKKITQTLSQSKDDVTTWAETCTGCMQDIYQVSTRLATDLEKTKEYERLSLELHSELQTIDTVLKQILTQDEIIYALDQFHQKKYTPDVLLQF